MYTIKSIILFILVLFGAYAQHSAESGIKIFNDTMAIQSQITSADHEHMRCAIALGHDNHAYAFGSVVVKDNEVIGEGWNKTAVSLDPSAHAEVEAIRDACKNSGTTILKGATIYAGTKPCPMCLSLIYLTGIEKVYYCIPGSPSDSLSAGQIYKALNTPQPDGPVREVQIIPESVSQLLSSYKKSNETVL